MFALVSPRRACRIALTATLLGSLGGPVFAQKGTDLAGLWQTENAGSTVRIARCGAGYCGTIAATPGPGLDAKNPDPALQSRKLVGVQIMSAGTPSGEAFEGSLYNPNDGKTYAGSLTPKGPDTVEVAGCVLSVLCKRQTWRRIR
ncbi:DUF2147 domain-containing protein [Methylorubrum sp. POS3]|uniref:DUF2147 domain-containing protein n=1 Tax=Methylorubrum sp. POS3 TaxID=2998492 RepID=UPI00372A848D